MVQGREPDDDRSGVTRRAALGRIAVGTAAAWGAPVLLSTSARAAGTLPLPIQFVAAGPQNSVSGGSNIIPSPTLPLTMPAGIVAGDRLFAFISTNPNTDSVTGTGGTWSVISNASFNLTASGTRGMVLSRVATGAETSATFTRTFTGTVLDGGIFRGFITAYRNVASLGAVNQNTSTSSGSQTFPAVTTTVDDSWVVRFGASGGGNRLWATAVAPDTQRANSGNNDRSIVAFDRIIATAGSSGTATLNLPGGGVLTQTGATRHSVVLVPFV